ncbi:hypothetical protein NUU61_004464 [Penicillium alfredii]|uniref:Uncharacterized protein n=1 Tax=Penicillium alfredii TaxID=1506179 RepID=A0A9W9KEN1_9EURO|nr:uncharacterized protein NUU61_004464 [Penicillium alfredii]KAJ5102242.1 hypothetical protein NUU61_004464 [Penicillium alfredii]
MRDESGNPVKFDPDTLYIQPERKELAELEFKNRDVYNIDYAELIEDRIRSLELRLRLHGLYVPKPLRKRVKFKSMPAIKSEQQPFPMKSVTGLECPVCLGATDIHLNYHIAVFVYIHNIVVSHDGSKSSR